MSIEDGPSSSLLNIREVAELLNVSVTSVRRLQRARKLPFVKVGGSVRFDQSDIASYMKARRVPAID